MNAGEFDGPSRGSGVEARFSQPLQRSPQIHRADSPRQQISCAGERATAQSRQECALAAFSIGKPPDKRPAAERHNGERADDQSDGAIRCAEITMDMRRKTGQHRAEPKKSQERCGNQAPKAPPE